MRRIWRVLFPVVLGMLFWSVGHAESLKLLEVSETSLPGQADEAHGRFSTGRDGFSTLSDAPGVIRITTPSRGNAWGQWLNRPLSRTPVLTWSWRAWLVDPEPGVDDLPIRLIVGFSDRSMSDGVIEMGADGLPRHERAVILVWGTKIGDEGRDDVAGTYARHFATAEKADGSWWEQTLDLEALHRSLWPGQNMGPVHIAFIAVAMRDSSMTSQADVSKIELISPPTQLP